MGRNRIGMGTVDAISGVEGTRDRISKARARSQVMVLCQWSRNGRVNGMRARTK